MILSSSTPLIYLITDRRALPREKNEKALSSLMSFVNRAAASGIDMIQIRERDLPARDLFYIAEVTAQIAARHKARVLINDRADVAACARVGVHLTTRSMAAAVVRKAFGPEFLIGVSTHSLEEASAAQDGGADFVVFGPIFDTESKKQYGPPVGLDALRAVTDRVRIPVLALGGINMFNFHLPIDAGAAGVAGISLFTKSPDLESIVRVIKNRPKP